MISGDVVDHCLDVVNKSITPTIFVIVVSKCTVNLLPHKLHVAKMGFKQVNSELQPVCTTEGPYVLKMG